MKLQKKLTYIILIPALGVSSLLFAFVFYFTIERFQVIQKEQDEREINTLQVHLENHLEFVRSFTIDWAIWDDTYDFIHGKNKTYAISHLGPSFLLNDLSFLIISNKAQQPLFHRAWDLGALVEVPISEEILNRINNEIRQKFSKNPNKMEHSGFLFSSKDEIYVFAINRTFDSQQKKPSNGFLTFGRKLTGLKFNELAEKIDKRLSIQKNGKTHYQAKVPLTPFRIQKSLDQSTLGIILHDPASDNDYKVLFTSPNQLILEGKKFALSIIAIIVLLSLAILFLIYTFVRKTILTRILKLQMQLNEIQNTNKLSKRLELSGNDEIVVFKNQINEMLERLEKEQAILAQSLINQTKVDSAGLIAHEINNPLQIASLSLGKLQVLVNSQPSIDPEARIKIKTELERAENTLARIAFKVRELRGIAEKP